MTETLTTTVEAPSQNEISARLARATEQVVEYMYDPEFLQKLDNTDISQDLENHGKYWEQLAMYTSRKASSEKLSPLERQSLQLAGFLPNFLEAKYLLSVSGNTLTDTERKNAKRTACVYNGLIRDFVSEYPQSSAELRTSLLNTTLQTIGAESRDFLDYADTAIEDTLKGVKHELAFAATLDAFGIPYRPATTREDLAGRDLVLSVGEHETGVDVKASLTAVDAKNQGSNNTPVATKPNGDLIVFSLFTENDFDGGFVPTQEALDLKSTAIAGYLQAAVKQSIAKR